jgi:hypothetical protein
MLARIHKTDFYKRHRAMKNSTPFYKRISTILSITALLGLNACSFEQPEGEIQGIAGMAIAAERGPFPDSIGRYCKLTVLWCPTLKAAQANLWF